MTAEEGRMLRLAGAAVLDVFDTAIRLPNEATRAGLGPEDLRFMKVLQSFVGAERRADQA